QVDRAVLFRHSPGVEVLPGLLDRAAMVFDAAPAPLQPDEGRGLRLRRAPEVVVLVSADRGRQAVCGAEQVQGAGLAIVAREDAGPRALLGGQRPVDPGYVRDELLPAELVSQALFERALMPDLGLRRGGADAPLV